MSTRFNLGHVILFTLLWTGMGLGRYKYHRRHMKSNHDTSADRYAAMVHDVTGADAGVGLEDAKMADLADSIEGVFSMDDIPTSDDKPKKAKGVPATTAKPMKLKVAQKALDTKPTKLFVENVTNPAFATVAPTVAKQPKLPVLKARAQVAKLTQPSPLPVAGKVGHINVSAVSAVIHAKAPAKLGVEGIVGHINVSTATALINQTQVAENRTKVIEEAVVSLPMASFALEDPMPVKNKTEPKFPGNATQKAAWEQKEKSLEDEVATLKARLTNASASLEPKLKQTLGPAAAGTFNAHADSKAAKKFMTAKGKGAEPMQPMIKQKKPKADWPTMASVAAPVSVNLGKAAAAAPPQKEAIQAQEGNTKKLTMGTAFTGTPAKKVESVLALDSALEREAVVDDDEETVALSTPASSMWNRMSTFFSWIEGTPTADAAAQKAVKPQVVAPRKAGSLLWVKQDSERTAQATREEHQHLVELTDTWGQMEKEDVAKEEDVRSEDMAERERAEAVAQPHTPTKAELKGRHGVEMSGFWKKLEKQDYNIEETVQSDDLVKYAQLTQDQDLQVSKASDILDVNNIPHVSHEANHDLRLPIHEPWLRRQQRDEAAERQIHDAPDLQMLQLQNRHQRK